MNQRVDIREDIKRYQDTLSYTSSKVDYSMGQNIYMLPSDMNLKLGRELLGITTKFSFLMKNLVWGNVEVNSLALEEPVIPMPKGHSTHKVITEQTQAKKPTHEEEKIAFVLFLTGGFTNWFMF